MAGRLIIPFPDGPECDRDRILFPECLYGDGAETRNAWKRIGRRAWNDGHWESALADAVMVPPETYPGPIAIRSYSRPWLTKARWWQFHWILEALVPSRREVFNDPSRQRALVLDGMQRFWYAVGMLEVNYADIAFAGAFVGDLPSQAECAEAHVPMLRLYVHWLPELLALADRFVTIARGCPPIACRRCEFLRTAFVLAYWCRYIDLRACHGLRSVTRDRIVAALLARRIIEPVGERFRLRE
jgi:hypothetical protein